MRPRTAVHRYLIASLLAGLVVTANVVHGSGEAVQPEAGRRYKAVAFDYLVLFNPDSMVAEVERAFPGKGREFTNLWRNRQFEYAWLRSITNQYVDFFDVTDDALVFAANAMKVDLTADEKCRLLDAYLHLDPWPDTAEALRKLRDAGVRVITLANFSPAMLRANADHAGLSEWFDALISTDQNHTYKPDARAYQLGVDFLQVRKDEIVFAAFGGWDAAGAKAFGYPTVWVNRFQQPAEQLGSSPDYTVRDLKGLLDIVLTGSPAH